jgi:rare lipoprotein A
MEQFQLFCPNSWDICRKNKIKLIFFSFIILSGFSSYKGHFKIGNPYKIEDKWYHPKVDLNYDEVGIASWYGPNFHRKKTANGEIFKKHHLTAAHPTLPIPSIVRVKNLENGKSIKVRINDRGPFKKDRIIDMSEYAAKKLGFENQGTTKVNVTFLEKDTIKLHKKLFGKNMLADFKSDIKTDDIKENKYSNNPQQIREELLSTTELNNEEAELEHDHSETEFNNNEAELEHDHSETEFNNNEAEFEHDHTETEFNNDEAEFEHDYSETELNNDEAEFEHDHTETEFEFNQSNNNIYPKYQF